MTTKYFSTWSESQFFQDQLARSSGIAYAVQVDSVDALIGGPLDEVKDIVITDDEELIAVFRDRGYDINYITAV